jgi:dethiobiotin synthetase
MSNYFITGTDTGVGKTWATLALMKAMQNRGKFVVGMKPVASGCKNTSEGLRNDDALQILQQSSSRAGQELAYEIVNPYAFEQAVAPHIAADIAGEEIGIEKIASAFNSLKKGSDSVFVEGIGGWCVPLGKDTMLADMVEQLDLQVILVIGLRQGCINHALSTLGAIQGDGAKLSGWVTSQIDPDYAGLEETMAVFHSRINAPFLGSLSHMDKFDLEAATSHIIVDDSLE